MKLSVPAVCLSALVATSTIAAPATTPSMDQVHGISRSSSGLFYAGAANGLFRVDVSGNQIEQINDRPHLLSVTIDPANNDRIYAVQPGQNGNQLQLLVSDDGGYTFQPAPQPTEENTNIQQLLFSPLDSSLIFAKGEALFRSTDNGNSWERTGNLPKDTFQLAASTINSKHLFAATRSGLLKSEDSGDTWTTLIPLPATAVETKGTQVYVFVVGKGLLSAQEASLEWNGIHNQFGAQVLIDFELTGSDGVAQSMVGLSQFGRLLQSNDSGQSWNPLPDRSRSLSPMEQQGQRLFQQYCQSCHGPAAVGETYSEAALTSKDYFMAPALNGSMHAWHHTDEQLLNTIREGSPRTAKMPAWKEQLSDDQIQSVIAYLKSMWGKRQKRCQGPKHMDQTCMAGG